VQALMESRPLPYAPGPGLTRLRGALAQRVTAASGLACDAEWVVVTAGASAALAAAILAGSAEGAEVLCPDPGYAPFAQLTRRLARVPVHYPASVGRGNDLAALEAAITPRSSALIWNSPSNPAGDVATPEAARLVAELARDRGLTLISDEVYCDLAYDRPHVSPGRWAGERYFGVYSFSKSHGMAGWRVGWLVAPPELAAEASKAHWALSMSVSTLGQAAAMGALAAPDSYLEGVRDALRARRDAVHDQLTAAGMPAARPQGGFFFWLDVRGTGRSGAAFCDGCREEAGVALTPGHVFGPASEGFARLSFGGPENQVLEGARRVAACYGRWAAPD